MKLVQVKCANCGAIMMVPEGSNRVQCDYCDSWFTIDDEADHVKFDNAKQAGYDFERGRIRAQKEEAARQNASSYKTTVYETEEYVKIDQNQSEPRYVRRTDSKKHWDPAQGSPTPDQRAWAIVRLVITFMFGWFGVHKFMDGKILMGLAYLFTFAFCGIGWVIDIILEIVELIKMYSY